MPTFLGYSGRAMMLFIILAIFLDSRVHKPILVTAKLQLYYKTVGLPATSQFSRQSPIVVSFTAVQELLKRRRINWVLQQLFQSTWNYKETSALREMPLVDDNFGRSWYIHVHVRAKSHLCHRESVALSLCRSLTITLEHRHSYTIYTFWGLFRLVLVTRLQYLLTVKEIIDSKALRQGWKMFLSQYRWLDHQCACKNSSSEKRSWSNQWASRQLFLSIWANKQTPVISHSDALERQMMILIRARACKNQYKVTIWKMLDDF